MSGADGKSLTRKMKIEKKRNLWVPFLLDKTQQFYFLGVFKSLWYIKFQPCSLRFGQLATDASIFFRVLASVANESGYRRPLQTVFGGRGFKDFHRKETDE